MEIVTDPSAQGSGETTVRLAFHVDGQVRAWVNTYQGFVTLEFCHGSAAVSVFVQNVDQADELIQLLQIARTELASRSTPSNSTAACTGSPGTRLSSVSADSSAGGVT